MALYKSDYYFLARNHKYKSTSTIQYPYSPIYGRKQLQKQI